MRCSHWLQMLKTSLASRRKNRRLWTRRSGWVAKDVRPQVEALEDRALLAVSTLGISASQLTTSTTMTNFTVDAGTDRLLVVAAADPIGIFNDPVNKEGITSVTFNGTPMTAGNHVNDGAVAVDTIWYMQLGTSTSSVTGDIVMTTAAGNFEVFIGAVAFSGVDQTTPVDLPSLSGVNNATNLVGSPTAGDSSVSVASDPGDLVFDLFDTFRSEPSPGSPATISAGSGQTVINDASFTHTDYGSFRYATSIKPGVSPTTMSWTSNAEFILQAAININQVTTTAPTVNLSVSSTTGSEAGRTVITVTATAADAVSGDQTVDVLVSGTGITVTDSRLSDDDLAAAGIQIQILDGETTGSVTFTILDDLSDETDEVATLTLANPSSGLTLGSSIAQSITLTDDDDAAVSKHLGLPTSGDFRVVLNGTLQEIYDGNGTLISSDEADSAAIVIQGTSADDTLIVDFSGGNPIPAGGITFHGGNGEGHDGLVMIYGTASRVTHTFANASDGSIATVIDGSTRTVNYIGLEPIVDFLSATDRVFTFNGGAETITLIDADGANTVIDSNLAESVIFANPTGSLTINAGSGNDTVTVVLLDITFSAELTINGDDGNDSLTGSAYNESLDGGAGHDLLRGLGGDDTLSGGSGTNSLDGGTGSDVISEVSGVRGTLTNTKFVGSGKDKLARIERAIIFGTDDNNVLDASAFTLGSVTLIGGDGNDTIRGSKGNDALIGDDGDDLMYGNSGHDRMFGGNGQDRMRGGAGNDTMLGEAGQDTLAGGAGHDAMSGGDGNDFLNGETGNDTLLGGAGNDTLRTSHDFDYALGEDGDDRIESRSKDVISGGEGNNTIVGRYAQIDETFVFDFNQLLDRPFP